MGLKQGELPLTQQGDEFGIAVQEIIDGEVCWHSPADLLEGVIIQRTTEIDYVIEHEFDRVLARIVMACTIGFWADVGFDAEFLPQFTPQAALIGLSRFHFAAGKLPLQRKGGITPTLADQEPPTLLNETSHYPNRGCGLRHPCSPLCKV